MFQRFESSVNSEGIETQIKPKEIYQLFESSVNSEGIETMYWKKPIPMKFESSVNSEGIETPSCLSSYLMCLRAV